MNPKLPADAFSFYVSLGPQRSYQAVADKYGVSKRTVTNTASRDKWQARVIELEAKSRQRTEEQILETLDELNERHLKIARFVMSKGLEALRSMAIVSVADALRAVEQGLKYEREVRAPASNDTGRKFHLEQDAREKADMVVRFLAEIDELEPKAPDEHPGSESSASAASEKEPLS